MARSLAKRKQGQGKDDDKGEDPPRPRRIPITIDGEVPLDQATSGRTPQPGPPRPDGSYTPHGLRDGYAHSQSVDLAAWKQADYGQMAFHACAFPSNPAQATTWLLYRMNHNCESVVTQLKVSNALASDLDSIRKIGKELKKKA